MSERTRNIIVGITLMLGLVGVGVMLLMFGQIGLFFERTYAVNVELPNAAGLGEGSPVRMNGLTIGQVSWVQMREPAFAGVAVTTKIQRNYRIPAGARVRVERTSLLGGAAAMTFDVSGLGAAGSESYLPTDGSAVVAGRLGVASGLPEPFREPVEQLNKLTANFEVLAREWTEVGHNINLLVEPRSAVQVDSAETQPNVSSMIARLDARLADLKGVLDNLQIWTGDVELRGDVKAAAADAAAVMAKLNSDVVPLMSRLTAAADNLSQMLLSFQQLADEARNGQGTLGKLTNDPGLYNDLTDAVQRLTALLTEARLLIQKWKAEGVPIQY